MAAATLNTYKIGLIDRNSIIYLNSECV